MGKKLFGLFIALALIAVVLYAIFSGLPADVISPFRPPNP